MFCTECGTKLQGAFCSNCGTASPTAKVQTTKATDEQLVIAQILLYVEENWSEDFEDFIAENTDVFNHAREVAANRAVTASQLNSIEATYSDFISGGGYPRDTRFASLQEFKEEMGEE